MLATLYDAPSGGQSSSHAYMLLIVVLILSQDPHFARRVHGVGLRSVPWYKGRMLHGTSLGATGPTAMQLGCQAF